MTKRCTLCHVEKPVAAFYVRRKTGRPLPRCKACTAEAAKTPERRAQRKAIARRYHAAHAEQMRAKQREYHRRHRELYRECGRQWRERVRLQTIAAYGGACACCGETRDAFLTIDHIERDGARERIATPGNRWGRGGAGTMTYMKLRRLGFPKDRYRLLCFNCNCGRERTGGVCVHEAERARSSAA